MCYCVCLHVFAHTPHTTIQGEECLAYGWGDFAAPECPLSYVCLYLDDTQLVMCYLKVVIFVYREREREGSLGISVLL